MDLEVPIKYEQSGELNLTSLVQKVPPSGGSPVFKLTLPHSIVHTHLQHLIDADFEIASSATAVQCWQGSIAPRRNKDRSEYTLQVLALLAVAADPEVNPD